MTKSPTNWRGVCTLFKAYCDAEEVSLRCHSQLERGTESTPIITLHMRQVMSTAGMITGGGRAVAYSKQATCTTGVLKISAASTCEQLRYAKVQPRDVKLKNDWKLHRMMHDPIMNGNHCF